MILIFTEDEDDGIKSSLPFKNFLFYFDQQKSPGVKIGTQNIAFSESIS